MLRIGEGRVYVDLVAVGNQAGLSSDRTETCWKWGPVWWWQVAKNMRVDAAAAASLAAVQLGHRTRGRRPSAARQESLALVHGEDGFRPLTSPSLLPPCSPTPQNSRIGRERETLLPHCPDGQR